MAVWPQTMAECFQKAVHDSFIENKPRLGQKQLLETCRAISILILQLDLPNWSSLVCWGKSWPDTMHMTILSQVQMMRMLPGRFSRMLLMRKHSTSKAASQLLASSYLWENMAQTRPLVRCTPYFPVQVSSKFFYKKKTEAQYYCALTHLEKVTLLRVWTHFPWPV